MRARNPVAVRLEQRVFVLIAAAAIAGASTGAQTQRDTPVRPPVPVVVKGSAVLGGVVTTDEERSAPIRRALVTLTGGAGGIVQTASDDDGRFTFIDLPAGSYALTAEKPGFVKTFVGSRRPGRGPSTPMALQDGQRLTNVAIKLIRGAAIAGAVFDDNGQPVPSAQLSLLQPRIVNGERRLLSVPGITWATSDDRGRYRFYGVPPGEYTVRSSGGQSFNGEVRLTTQADLDAVKASVSPASAVPAQQPQVFQAAGYHPAAGDSAGAVFFTVAAGEERTGVDVRLTLSRAVRLEGVALGPGGQPLANMSVGVANVSTGSMWASPGFVRPQGPDGRFVLPTLPAGRYLFYGRAADGPGAAETLWTETEVLVGDQDVSAVTLQFQPGATVSGRVTYKTATATTPAAGLRVLLTPVPTIAGAAIAPAPVSPAPDGAFTFTGVPPGRFRVAIANAGAWSLRSAMFSGRDTLDALLDVPPGQPISDLALTLTDQPTEVSGTLVDASGRPAAGYVVIVFSSDRAHWTIAPRRSSGVVRIGSNGAYRVTGLPPGEYYLAALIDADAQDVADPSFLDQLVPVSLRITLSEGERKQQDLRVGG